VIAWGGLNAKAQSLVNVDVSDKPRGLSSVRSLSLLRLPTDPDVRDDRIRLLWMRLRYVRQTER